MGANELDCVVTDLCRQIREGKDEVSRLRAENAKLLAALKPFGDIAKQTEHWSGPPVSVPLYVIRSAAAALKETGDE